MKSFILSLAFSLISLFASADNSTSTVAPDELADKQRFYTEVLTGEWVGHSQNETLYYCFGANGKASVVAQKVNGPLRVFNATWSLVWQNEKWLLQMEETISKRIFGYEIDLFSDKSILGHDEMGNSLSLDLDESLFATDRLDREDILMAQWQSTYISAEGEPANVGLQLNPDGTYTRTFSAAYVTVAESGTWVLTCDGNFIFFRPEGSGEVRASRVTRANQNSLVLTEALEAPEYGVYFDAPVQKIEYNISRAENTQLTR